jgi:hypothetical protein
MTYGILGLQVVVGVVGFALHVIADLGRRALPFGQRFVFGAPTFAPLLFVDLALLAALGLWALSGTGPARAREIRQKFPNAASPIPPCAYWTGASASCGPAGASAVIALRGQRSARAPAMARTPMP